MYLRADSAAGVRFLTSVRQGRGIYNVAGPGHDPLVASSTGARKGLACGDGAGLELRGSLDRAVVGSRGASPKVGVLR